VKAVITGATRGIGLEIATRLLHEGFDLALTSRNAQDLEALRARLEKEHPGRTVLVKAADLAVRQQVLDFADFVNASWPAVDVLVNNAGIFLPGSMAGEDSAAFERMMSINVAAVYHLTKSLLPGMMARRKGHVFTICSSASLQARAGIGSYSASKYALLGLTENFREELRGHGIKVTAILPGSTYTSSWEGTSLPKEQFIQPSDIAGAVLMAYRASPAALVGQIVIQPVQEF
jgi:short-subunit dehydrogenase